ncbi:UNVERIFIED_CONTAM: hypothetical protein GTU68_044142 [Idotea baltica]|nr:hypothetical protein [Idotea baltica]
MNSSLCGYQSDTWIHKNTYFSNYFLHMSDVTFDMKNNQMTVHKRDAEPWKVTLVDTGEGTMTGGRLKRVKEYIQDGTFCLTYGDGVGDINIGELIDFHKKQGTLATLTAVRQPGRFGAFSLQNGDNKIHSFSEKPMGDGNDNAMINGGFFVCEPEVIDFIEGDQTVWERGPMEELAQSGNLAAYQHDGFWQPMDTLRDRNVLENLWSDKKAPWKIWKNNAEKALINA